MKTLVLGKTGLTVTKTALGCLPLQRCTEADAVDLIRAAFDPDGHRRFLHRRGT